MYWISLHNFSFLNLLCSMFRKFALRNIQAPLVLNWLLIAGSTGVLIGFEHKSAFANCNIFGCSQSSVADCNAFGCPNSPHGAECNVFGCPASPTTTQSRQQQSSQQSTYPSRPTVSGVSTSTNVNRGSINGISYEIRGSSNSSIQAVDNSIRMISGSDSIVIANNRIYLNGSDRGSVKPGDFILVDANRQLFINGRRR